MSERYTKLFVLPENQYASGAPVILAAGALLKDNQTGKVLAQLKFKSISAATITAIKVKIHTFDIEGNELESVDEFPYLDLNISRNTEFGQKTPIPLPNRVARSFSVECTKVIFAKGSIWNSSDELWEPLPQRVSIHSHFNKIWLAEQYRRDVGSQAEYAPIEHKDLWYCTCGAVNHSNESQCQTCHIGKSKMFGALSIDALTAHKAAFDAEMAAKEEAQRIETETRKKKNKKTAAIIAIAAAACVALIIAWNMLISPGTAYFNAVILMENGKYEEAITAFEALNGFLDSEAKIMDCKTKNVDVIYNQAVIHVDAGEYDKAMSLFTKLEDYECIGNYEDVIDCVNEYKLKVAASYIESKNYQKAIAIYNDLDDLENIVSAKLAWLRYYIRSNGTSQYRGFGIKETVGKHAAISLIVTKEDQFEILIELNYDMSNEIIDIVLSPDNTEASIQYKWYIFTHSYNTGPHHTRDYYMKASGSCDINLFSFTKNTNPVYLNFSVSGKGSRDIDSNSFSARSMDYINEYLPVVSQILEETGIGVTLADLGFISYK